MNVDGMAVMTARVGHYDELSAPRTVASDLSSFEEVYVNGMSVRSFKKSAS